MNLSDKIVSSKRPFVIAGPCSAETQEQVNEVCLEISKMTSTLLLRAGIWKPRTRPDSFEGVGELGLNWLVEAGKITGLPTTTEVANQKHVELALNAGIDVLWLGARTTVNPFAVQEIAEAVEGKNVPIMIKNPVNPDLHLWIGAFERFEKLGTADLTAIHRGFSLYNHPKYRNVPNWEIPIAFKENRPDIPILCDPSHITGNRSLLQAVSQKAMDLNFDGLMIETHPNPIAAWSDAEQQVTPKELSVILNNLILRSKEVSTNIASQIDEIRDTLRSLDDRLFELLSDRMQMSEEIGKLKRENHVTILQEEHWRGVLKLRLEKNLEYALTPQFIRQLMDAIHQESIRRQTAVMNPKKIKKGE